MRRVVTKASGPNGFYSAVLGEQLSGDDHLHENTSKVVCTESFRIAVMFRWVKA